MRNATSRLLTVALLSGATGLFVLGQTCAAERVSFGAGGKAGVRRVQW